MIEQTLIIIKPDGVKQGLIGTILNRIERKGYTINAIKKVKATEDELRLHYRQHEKEDYYPDLIDYMMSGEIVVIVAEGTNVVYGVRSLMGTTNPTKAIPGTIRGDYGREWDDKVIRNIIHGSDCIVNAMYEISIWFP